MACYSSLLQKIYLGGNLSRFLSDDSVHLNETGYAILSLLILEALDN